MEIEIGVIFLKQPEIHVPKNAIGQYLSDDILANPNTTFVPNKFGGLNFYAPNGRGACFLENGTFRGFLQPPPRGRF